MFWHNKAFGGSYNTLLWQPHQTLLELAHELYISWRYYEGFFLEYDAAPTRHEGSILGHNTGPPLALFERIHLSP